MRWPYTLALVLLPTQSIEQRYLRRFDQRNNTRCEQSQAIDRKSTSSPSMEILISQLKKRTELKEKQPPGSLDQVNSHCGSDTAALQRPCTPYTNSVYSICPGSHLGSAEDTRSTPSIFQSSIPKLSISSTVPYLISTGAFLTIQIMPFGTSGVSAPSGALMEMSLFLSGILAI